MSSPSALPDLTTKDVPLQLWGGEDLEMSPTDVPEGVSPGCNDMAFVPGSTFSRPCLSRCLTNGLTNNPTLTYLKTYEQPNGDPLNLFLDFLGNLWQEDVNNTPGTATLVGAVAAGSYGKSVTAFGREYIAFSDGIHGTDIPRQYDGTNLDRVTQDAPGAPPTITNYQLPSLALSETGSGSGKTIATITSSDSISVLINDGGDGTGPVTDDPEPIRIITPTYQTFWTTLTVVTTSPHGFSIGDLISISGDSVAEFNFPAINVSDVVNATTFKVNFYSQDNLVGTGGTAQTESPILSRVNNLVTGQTATAHGLKVGYQVIISGVTDTAVGGGITGASRTSNVGTITTATAHGLVPGQLVDIACSDASFNQLSATVLSTPSTTTFTYANGGTDTIVGGPTGTVGDIWNGTFYVTAVPTGLTFTYSQVGGNDLAASPGTMTPNGQITPGQHQMVVMFITRAEAETAPSPPVTFTANGGQYALIQNIPIGPPNTVARILGFTGANGNNFFQIPDVPFANGIQIGSSTIINDNITSSVILDFSDNTLFSAEAIDIDGNNLFAQVVLGPVIGFFSYASRLLAWGEANKIQNLLNMGFDGGYLATAPTQPLGWTVVGTGTLDTGLADFGFGWNIVGPNTGELNQGAYQDALHVPILSPNTNYTWRMWAKAATTGTWTVEITSATAGLLASAVFDISTFSANGSFVSANFNFATPNLIPTDAIIRAYATNIPNAAVLEIDEQEMINADNPYRPNLFRVSYAFNPEAFDGVTGDMGSADDPNPIMGCFIQETNLYFLTTKRQHYTKDIADAEPSGWTVNQKANNCGAVSIFAITGQPEQQGEYWDMWVSDAGLRIFAGGEPDIISYEQKPTWKRINQDAKQFTWCTYDANSRRILIGLPLDANTQPNLLKVLDIRELDTAQQIASASPVHIGFTGRMISSDLTRKWSTWNLPLRCGGIIARPDGITALAVGSGTNAAGNSFGNFYTFDDDKLTDDNYGKMTPYYITYAFVNHDTEQQLGVGSHRKLFVYFTIAITGVGQWFITPLGNSLNNPWPSTPLVPLKTESTFDSGMGLNVSSERVFFKIQVVPLKNQTDVSMQINKFVVSLKQDSISPVGGVV